ncbi:hypothetical protein [Nocardioides sp. YIM 152315]|uniref:hypothetical protein n=1 Tax=Nocardioides sp. YIM 152315 TaxID=3031760 RepID=UPI0023DA1F16|nr:hypothetical protein [Nocardioides sp. YIM 152315]MDF1605444.1 hypothetical protein [Nocardioides sp. YIM 152315]
MNRPAYDYEQAHDFFETCTRNVLFAEHETGVQHYVGVSIIGAQSIDGEFFRGKAAQERLVIEAPRPTRCYARRCCTSSCRVSSTTSPPRISYASRPSGCSPSPQTTWPLRSSDWHSVRP